MVQLPALGCYAQVRREIVVGLQFHGAEVQKDQDVLVLVSIVPRAEQTGPNPNVIRILITGADPIPADASQAAMLEKVNAWSTE